jgi:hypothetical protein
MMAESPIEAGAPLACTLTALTAEQRVRQQTVFQQVQAAVLELRELPDGYGFRFPADAALLMVLAEFINLERVCCAFFSFTLEVAPESGPIWLRITGREGVKQVLQAELGLS